MESFTRFEYLNPKDETKTSVGLAVAASVEEATEDFDALAFKATREIDRCTSLADAEFTENGDTIIVHDPALENPVSFVSKFH